MTTEISNPTYLFGHFCKSSKINAQKESISQTSASIICNYFPIFSFSLLSLSHCSLGVIISAKCGQLLQQDLIKQGGYYIGMQNVREYIS